LSKKTSTALLAAFLWASSVAAANSGDYARDKRPLHTDNDQVTGEVSIHSAYGSTNRISIYARDADKGLSASLSLSCNKLLSVIIYDKNMSWEKVSLPYNALSSNISTILEDHFLRVSQDVNKNASAMNSLKNTLLNNAVSSWMNLGCGYQ